MRLDDPTTSPERSHACHLSRAAASEAGRLVAQSTMSERHTDAQTPRQLNSWRAMAFGDGRGQRDNGGRCGRDSRFRFWIDLPHCFCQLLSSGKCPAMASPPASWLWRGPTVEAGRRGWASTALAAQLTTGTLPEQTDHLLCPFPMALLPHSSRPSLFRNCEAWTGRAVAQMALLAVSAESGSA